MKSRRSTKIFKRKRVSRTLVLRALEAATWAPSAHNAQPWRFIIIEKPDVKRRLAEAMGRAWKKDLERDGVAEERRRAIVDESITLLSNAPVLVLACLTMEDMDRYPDEKRRKAEHIMGVQSIAAATQNLLLMAHFQGLGACWSSAPLFCQNEVNRVLGIPDKEEAMALIVIGYPEETPQPPEKMTLDQVVYMDSWGNRE